MTKQWYALQVKPHKDRAVAEYLEMREIEYFAPMIRVKPKNPRSAKQRPYFPGYLFIHVNLQLDGQQAYSWLPGTRGLVSFDDEPAVVSTHLVDEIQRRLAQLNAQGGIEHVDFQKGDRVRIVSGPFAGYDAIFDVQLSGKERVQVLLRFLSSQPQPVQLDQIDIEKTRR